MFALLSSALGATLARLDGCPWHSPASGNTVPVVVPPLKRKEAAEQAVDPLATFILGSVPPALAILAELKSPVSSAVIKPQSFAYSEQFVPQTITDTAVRDGQRAQSPR